MLPENPLDGPGLAISPGSSIQSDACGKCWKGGGKDKRGRGWMATMERRTWDLYIRAAESRGGEVISVPVAD